MFSLANRLYAWIVFALTLSIALTLLAPTEVKADNSPQLGLYTGPTELSGVGARQPLEFQSYVQSGQCVNGSEQPWMMVYNVDTKEQYWGGYIPSYSTKVTFKDIDTIRYPGATIRIYMYDRKNLNPVDGKCVGEQQPDFATATPTVIGPDVKITWKPMNLFDAYYVEGKAKVQTDVPSSVGNISTYAIYDYGKSSQTVSRNDNAVYSQCNYSSQNSSSCTADTGRLLESATGFALVPNNLPAYSGTQWPPPGAITSTVALRSETGGPANIPDMTKGGPSSSSQDSRVPSADPIDSYSGNFFKEDTDLSIPGRIGISLARSYSIGNLGTSGAFGDGWDLGYDMKVTESGDHATLTEENGNSLPFTLQSTGYVGDSPVIRASLEKTDSGWDFKRLKDNKKYVFDTSGYLSRIEDRNGNAVTVERDDSHRVVLISEGSKWVSISWDGNNKPEKTVDNSGRSVSYSYDARGHLSSVTTPEGHVSSYSYDSLGRMVTVTNASGGVLTNAYDSANRVSTQTSPSGRITRMSYGTPDALSQATNTETTGTAVKTFDYIKGRITRVSDSSDSTKDAWFFYNKQGELDSSRYLDSTIHRMTFQYDSRGNIVTSEDTAAKKIETFQWDYLNQLVLHKDATGITTEDTYDPNGNLTQEKITPSTGGSPRVTSHEVSSTGDIISTTNPLGGKSLLEYSGNGELTSLTDPMGGKTTFAYDSAGRVLKKVSPGGNVSGVSNAEALKFTESRVYDADDNTVSVTTQSGTTSYQYDAKSHPTRMTDPRGKVKSLTYDADGRVTDITYPDGSTDSLSYDSSTGDRASWTDSKGRVTTYSHSGSTSTTTSPDGMISTVLSNTLWDYNRVDTYLTEGDNPRVQISQSDPVSGFTNSGDSKNYFQYDVQGRIKSDSTAVGNGTYVYDGFGNLSSKTSSAAGRDVSYQYDVAGNITRITYPDGTFVSRVMDTAGRVTDITDWSGVTYHVEYAPGGSISKVASSTGLRYEQQYDGTRPTQKSWLDSVDQVIATFGSTYDSSGLVASDSKSVGTDPVPRSFTWGDNGNLTGVNAQTIGWDGRYLTSNESFQSLNYDSATGRLETAVKADASTVNFTYDIRGNRTSMSDGTTSTNYTWDLFNRLKSIGNDTYTYGVDGMRTTVNGNQQVYDQNAKLISDGANKYLWSADGTLLAQAPLGAGAGTTPSQAVTDAMGSVYAVVQRGLVPQTTNQYQFNVLAKYSYSTFGARSLIGGSDVSAIGFVSEQHDTSGLIYLRHRYYDPAVGQFISSDPLLTKTLDAYGYTMGNPLQMIDPLGMWGETKEDWGDLSTNLGYASLVASGVALGSLGVSFFVPITAPVLVPVAGVAAQAGITFGWAGVIASTVNTRMVCDESGQYSTDCQISAFILGVGVLGATSDSFGVTALLKSPLKEFLVATIGPSLDAANNQRTQKPKQSSSCG